MAYLSYDGALDPLGATQVVPYLEGLAGRGVLYELITFEKPERLADASRNTAMAARLARAGVGWHPLKYHKSPRVPATIFDVIAGAIRLRRLARGLGFGLLHCRGEITPMMVRMARLNGPMLLDMRGFFANERVDAGSWAAGSLVDRSVRAMEGQNVRRARRVVVLTERGRTALIGRGVTLPIDVIPTCVDCEQFDRSRFDEEPRFDLVYFGSLGGWYMTEEMLAFVKEAREVGPVPRVLFLANNVDAATRTRLNEAGVTLQSSTPEDVPRWLARCRATFFFIRATPSKIASCPTKLAEALAMGLPVLTGPGVGDVDQILAEEGVGVVLSDFSSASFRLGWRAMKELLSRPGIEERCRAVAQNRLSLDLGVDRYFRVYQQMDGGGSP